MLVGPCLAKSFFSLIENIKISDDTLKNCIEKYKEKQLIQDPFYDDKILILFPDLITCKDLPIIFGMSREEMEKQESAKFPSSLMVNIAQGDESVSK